MKNGSGTYAVGKDANGNEVGYVFVTVSKGYGGDVKIMTGIDKDGAVTGISPLELNETAGLGMKAQNDSFLDQFKGKVKDIAVNKNSASGNEIQALTGATITSKAVTAAVNEALSYYDSNLKRGGVKWQRKRVFFRSLPRAFLLRTPFSVWCSAPVRRSPSRPRSRVLWVWVLRLR